ncbi:hypothetical protein GUJ93_ZPchr0013g34847 [Zizania palustris]|uniref:Uncharacterized protein n=1 Tax=Zizania palustris TaxID=103762 RepID=A0A8J6BW17_ZIZPA|nr:hypothetical protein GUJ93_ZPchr0013g34847 [Zizania palustris]
MVRPNIGQTSRTRTHARCAMEFTATSGAMRGRARESWVHVGMANGAGLVTEGNEGLGPPAKGFGGGQGEGGLGVSARPTVEPRAVGVSDARTGMRG